MAEVQNDALNYKIPCPWRILKADGKLVRFADSAPVWSEESYPMWRDRETAERGIAFTGLCGARAVPWPVVS